MDALGLGLTLGLAASISPGPLLVLVVTAALKSGRRAGVLTACAPLLSDALVVTVTLLLLDRVPARALGVLGVVGAVFVVWSGVQTVREARSASLDLDAEPTRTPSAGLPAAPASPPTTGPAPGFPVGPAPEAAAKPATELPAASAAEPSTESASEPSAEPAAEHLAAELPTAAPADPAVEPGSHASQPSPPRGSLFSILPTGSDKTGSLALRRAVLVNLLSPHPWIAWATALGPLTITTWRASPGAGVALLAGFYLTLVGGKVVIALLIARGRRRLRDTGYRLALTCAGLLLVLAGIVMGVEFATA
ncbi:LysE family transporter [Actinosynnema sp. NPDC023658]|uniref:LysE family transporter n=1 Tax=Actinosynnema sp. NPDC023658 TaxID=3155465 RepID=UPI0033CE9FA4